MTTAGMDIGLFAEELDAAWRSEAACIGKNAVFFIERGDGALGNGRVHPAKKVCKDCPVKQPCLDYALRTRPSFGVWGGLTQEELKRVRIRRREAG